VGGSGAIAVEEKVTFFSGPTGALGCFFTGDFGVKGSFLLCDGGEPVTLPTSSLPPFVATEEGGTGAVSRGTARLALRAPAYVVCFLAAQGKATSSVTGSQTEEVDLASLFGGSVGTTSSREKSDLTTPDPFRGTVRGALHSWRGGVMLEDRLRVAGGGSGLEKTAIRCEASESGLEACAVSGVRPFLVRGGREGRRRRLPRS
jgi:hypothetical protein